MRLSEKSATKRLPPEATSPPAVDPNTKLAAVPVPSWWLEEPDPARSVTAPVATTTCASVRGVGAQPKKWVWSKAEVIATHLTDAEVGSIHDVDCGAVRGLKRGEQELRNSARSCANQAATRVECEYPHHSDRNVIRESRVGADAVGVSILPIACKRGDRRLPCNGSHELDYDHRGRMSV